MNKHNRNNNQKGPLRLQNWDYGWKASYFITICTKNRNHFFGEIKEEQMHLSQVGLLADVFWHEIKNHAHYVELGAFVVMPNHIHGILTLTRNVTPYISNNIKASEKNETPGQRRIQNQGKNTISSIVGSYKSAVTKHAHRLGYFFGWQQRFYDHIIRSEEEFWRIHHYIINNPKNWNKDRFLR